MQWFDWVIVILPVAFVLWMGFYTRRYLKDVTAFLSAGRVCGRYVISVGDIANAISVIGLLTYVEVSYKTGFSLNFWSRMMGPIGIFLALYGYCSYRFRETKSQSIGQFLEIRYSRKFRIFAATLRSITEMIANMIMPALAARFFIYFLDLPEQFSLFGMQVSTFSFIMILVLTAAISIICMGGSLAIIVTDTIQGFICFPLMTFFVIFLLCKFSWTNEIMPVLSNRAAGENFLNPYDVYNLRDFNIFSLIVTLAATFLHRISWSGNGGSSTAAKSPHEQKMANLLGTWRNAICSVFYVLLAVGLLVFLNHQNFAKDAHKVRLELTNKIAKDIVRDPQIQTELVSNVNKIPVQVYNPKSDKPFSEKENLDVRYLNKVHKSLTVKDKTQGNSLFQQFRTIYYQQMLPVTLRTMLPVGMLGVFCLLMILAMISTDDSRIFSATITIAQDVILPFCKKQLTPRQHMWMLRWVAIGIGVFFFIGSSYMSQLDYLQLYSTLVCTMWMGGCGPVMVFGLYSRFGTAIGAWTSLLSGMFMAVVGVAVQRNWPDYVYPWLQQNGLVETTGKILEALSYPFEPIIVWRMDAIKCPINSFEWYFITMIVTLLLYCVVSWLTCKKPFNLERMLHRGKYALDSKPVVKTAWTWKNLYNKIVGITSEYTLGDKVIAWSYVFYSLIYGFVGTFLLVVIWNFFDPWPAAWWGYYFLIVFLVVPGICAAVTSVWFGICGTIDLRRMFRDLNARITNPLDDGRVEGNMSLADKSELEKIDRITEAADQPKK